MTTPHKGWTSVHGPFDLGHLITGDRDPYISELMTAARQQGLRITFDLEPAEASTELCRLCRNPWTPSHLCPTPDPA